MEIYQKGDKGTPIMILTGMGSSFYEWYDIAETLSTSNKVVMFHRPGLGLSEMNAEERNTDSVVKELDDIILQLELTEPIIFVGHSYGGLCLQHFAKTYPEKIAGIILVDSTSVNLRELDELVLPVLDGEGTDEIWKEKCLSYSLMEPRQLKDIINPILTEKQKELPLHIQERLLNFPVNPLLYKAMYLEICNWKKDTDYIKSLGSFPDVPLIVIGRDKEYNIKTGTEEGLPLWELSLLEEKWEELIIAQTNLSKYSELIIAKESSHSIHTDRPDVIIDAVYKLKSSATH